MADYPKITVLISRQAGNIHVEKHQQQINNQLVSKSMRFEEVDGADPESKDLRTKLWAVSGTRGYPLIYVHTSPGNYEFIGDFEAMQYMVECETFDDKFAACSTKR